MELRLGLDDFANLFGTTVDDISENSRVFISKYNFSHKILEGKEKDQIILKIIKELKYKKLPKAGQKRRFMWEKGWEENLKEFIENDYNAVKLIPKYIKPGEIIRIQSNYSQPKSSSFGMDFFDVFRSWIFQKYLKDVNAVYEFGCGTGHNLFFLAELFPKKYLYGLDWVESSVGLINLLAERKKYNLEGQVFNMFSPNKKLNLQKNSAVLTVHALEQLGSNFVKFIDFVIDKSPCVCLNIEPIYELYDKNNLIDHLAMEFHKKRNYLFGFLAYLKKLEKEEKIEILKVQRLRYGSCMYHDSYSFVVWKPKKI